MDAFEYNKFNSSAYFKKLLSTSTIVSYGFISAVDFDGVIVTLAVTGNREAEKVKCTFMNLGNEAFSLSLKPVKGMKVMVLSPNKAAEGMYNTKSVIQSSSPSIYSSQFAFCIPVMKSTSQALSALIIDNETITTEVKQEFLSSLYGTVEIDLYNDSSIELHEDTEHFRGCYGNMEQTFGMVEGASGAEKPGAYVYKETYGKHSSVEKNYESGFKTVIGKAYEKPFLADKGELLDSSAPVTIELGTGAPATLKFGSSVNISFGEDVITISADETGGLDIAVTGAGKVSFSAASGKLNFNNSAGSLKDIVDKVADLISGLTTIGPNVVAGAPYTATATPATAALSAELKTFAALILE